MTEQKQLDILAIGDIVVDAFIRLEDAELICDANKENCKLAVRYGDKVPYKFVEVCNAVGNAPNAAVSASRLGLSAGLLAFVGDDQNGRDCLDTLHKDNIDTTLVKTDTTKPTKYHYVLWYDVDRTILINNVTFPYSLGDIGSPKWIYFSSVGGTSIGLYHEVTAYLTAHPEIKLAFQPGTFDIQQGKEVLKDMYSLSEAVCINVEESQKILRETSRDLKVLLKGMATLGPKIILITDGIDGAYGYDTRLGDEGFFFMPVYPHEPVERTGAGDAFFSTVVSCLAMGKLLDEALTWGPVNSMSVVQQIGAQKGLLPREKLEEYLKNAPADYVLKKI
jgi:sugar/nucleoside kinase (ribokinase family)